MADRVYPAAKPTPAGTGTGPPPSFPATKARSYGAARPRPPPKRRSRSCCCACCLWITLVLVGLVLLAAIAGGVVYVLYRPHRPTFTVSSLRLTSFNVTASGKLTSKLDLSVTARNPNRKVVFLYDAADVSVYSGDVTVGTGSFPGFVHGTKNTTVLKTTVSAATGASLDSSTTADMKRKKNLPLEVEFETKVGVKAGGMKTKKLRIQVKCDGFSVAVPKTKAAAAMSQDVSCKVKLRFKIWKWTVLVFLRMKQVVVRIGCN